MDPTGPKFATTVQTDADGYCSHDCIISKIRSEFPVGVIRESAVFMFKDNQNRLRRMVKNIHINDIPITNFVFGGGGGEMQVLHGLVIQAAERENQEPAQRVKNRKRSNCDRDASVESADDEMSEENGYSVKKRARKLNKVSLRIVAKRASAWRDAHANNPHVGLKELAARLNRQDTDFTGFQMMNRALYVEEILQFASEMKKKPKLSLREEAPGGQCCWDLDSTFLNKAFYCEEMSKALKNLKVVKIGPDGNLMHEYTSKIKCTGAIDDHNLKSIWQHFKDKRVVYRRGGGD